MGAAVETVPAVVSGEYLAGTIFVLGVEAAVAEVQVCTDANQAIHLHLEARSSGIAAAVKSAYMEMDTVLADVGLRPVGDWADADIGGKLRRYDVRFRDGAYDYEYHRTTGPAVRERISLAKEYEWAHDLHTAVLLLRGWRPRLGETGHFAAVLGRHTWLTEVAFRGPDVVLHADGPYPAVRIEGVARMQHRKPELRETRRFAIWFSDDPDRIPLRAKTESSFGDIWLEMTQYRRGPVRACREYERVIPLPGDPLSPATGSAPASPTPSELAEPDPSDPDPPSF